MRASNGKSFWNQYVATIHYATMSIFLVGISMSVVAQNSASGPTGIPELRHGLEGMQFKGSWTIEGQPTGPDDVFIFQDGMFVSKDCLKWGYSPAPYWVRHDADGLHFHVVLQSPEHGTLEYEGTYDGSMMRADVLWTKERWYWTVEQMHEVTAYPITPGK